MHRSAWHATKVTLMNVRVRAYVCACACVCVCVCVCVWRRANL